MGTENERDLNFGHWREICERHGNIKTTKMDTHYPLQNKSEQGIKEAKQKDIRLSHTFRFNSKCSLLKLLCTLARLCEGTPLKPLRLDFFEIRVLAHNCDFRLFAGRTNRTRGQARRAHETGSSPRCPLGSHSLVCI